MFVVTTLKENITLLHNGGTITIGRVFIGKPTDNVDVLEAVAVIVGRTITKFNNSVMVAGNKDTVLSVQLGVDEKDFNLREATQ
jgi:hypothetical protein